MVAVEATVNSLWRLPRVDAELVPEMRSTGEVLGLSARYEDALRAAEEAVAARRAGEGRIAAHAESRGGPGTEGSRAPTALSRRALGPIPSAGGAVSGAACGPELPLAAPLATWRNGPGASCPPEVHVAAQISWASAAPQGRRRAEDAGRRAGAGNRQRNPPRTTTSCRPVWVANATRAWSGQMTPDRVAYRTKYQATAPHPTSTAAIAKSREPAHPTHPAPIREIQYCATGFRSGHGPAAQREGPRHHPDQRRNQAVDRVSHQQPQPGNDLARWPLVRETGERVRPLALEGRGRRNGAAAGSHGQQPWFSGPRWPVALAVRDLSWAARRARTARFGAGLSRRGNSSHRRRGVRDMVTAPGGPTAMEG